MCAVCEQGGDPWSPTHFVNSQGECAACGHGKMVWVLLVVSLVGVVGTIKLLHDIC